MGRISKVIRQSRLNVDRPARSLRQPSSRLLPSLTFDAQARLVRTLGYLAAKLFRTCTAGSDCSWPNWPLANSR